MHFKNDVKKIKRQVRDLEKIFEKHVSDKRLSSKMYEELLQFNIKKTITQLKWATDLKDMFPEKIYIRPISAWKGKCQIKHQ